MKKATAQQLLKEDKDTNWRTIKTSTVQGKDALSFDNVLFLEHASAVHVSNVNATSVAGLL